LLSRRQCRFAALQTSCCVAANLKLAYEPIAEELRAPGISKHDRPIGNRGLDACAFAYQLGNHEHDSEQADESREENGKPGHANLR
jgi:hypothetical protein